MADDTEIFPNPEPLKHPQSHYWKTTKKGRVIEGWVVTKNREGRTVRRVELVDPETGERTRKRVKRFERMPALVRIASGGTRMEGPRARDEVVVQEDGGEEGQGVAEGKRKKNWKKCVVM